MRIVLDEGEVYKNLFPLTLSRPAFKLVVGALSIIDRLRIFGKEEIEVVIRNPILRGKDLLKEEGDVVLFSNFIIDNKFLEKLISKKSKNFLIQCKDILLGYAGNLEEAKTKNEVLNVEVRIIEKPYDLIRHNKETLFEDLIYFSSVYEAVKLSNNVVGKYPVISNGVFNIEGNVMFDTREGPIFVGDAAYIQAFSRIEGPSYIGDSTLVVTGSNIRRSYIGKHCTIGGEVTNSIILDYTNSRHQSYIGDSYIGEWVNIGAHTVFSNIKNTYGEIKYDNLKGLERTGMRKLGAFLGDHSKTSISAMIFSGLSVGFSSHVLYFLDRSIPSFTMWSGYEKEGYEIYLESAIETAKRFMESKKIKFTEGHEKLFKNIFEYTEEERREAGIKKETFKKR
ncbi:MAG: putative sugar nucleotidyl transferase [Thermoproteota archaeon]|jgi:UDP-N-acetylglucosamine diphosphorylase/glucosamine-1-phosphate N-acetyltransferase|nr:putative sugar nucleotidyl transferase [Thermoproteota archaeon]